jgi:hypothetical protein
MWKAVRVILCTCSYKEKSLIAEKDNESSGNVVNCRQGRTIKACICQCGDWYQVHLLSTEIETKRICRAQGITWNSHLSANSNLCLNLLFTNQGTRSTTVVCWYQFFQKSDESVPLRKALLVVVSFQLYLIHRKFWQ